MPDKQNETNKKQGYSCGFFQAIVNCFSQCCKKQKYSHGKSNYDDLADDGLFDDSNDSMTNLLEMETPRAAQNETTRRDYSPPVLPPTDCL